jgi:hypothetical protein|uniref:Uncharacterized protein n=1 Tax=viral metagenome TaxID=1070528 RepID=A0A6C0I719_9ZZZZ
MIFRDVNGNLHVINRSDCKNDATYYQKIYNIKKEYTTKYKSVVSKNDK